MFGDSVDGLMSDLYNFRAAPQTGPDVTVRVVAYGGMRLLVTTSLPPSLSPFLSSFLSFSFCPPRHGKWAARWQQASRTSRSAASPEHHSSSAEPDRSNWSGTAHWRHQLCQGICWCGKKPPNVKTRSHNYAVCMYVKEYAYAAFCFFHLLQWDEFFDLIQPVAARVPYMVCIGNHERDWPDSGYVL